ncbi:MAG: NAD(P)-dependent oxidoreductase [Chthoniobacteraceae bacterium]|nr:NAD(P)-dependent oxidoreductase [Chthoniobacteraceae bacterium]
MKRILVTGATSFIGRVLCRQLRDSGKEVCALVRPLSANANLFQGEPGIQTIAGGLETLQSSLCGIGAIDATIHLAWDGVGSKGRADVAIQERNYAHSMELIDLSAAAGCRVFVGAGSQAEYGFTSDIISEETPCRPEIEYGKAKLRFTHDSATACRKLGIRWRMPRIFSVYGPHDHPWALIPSLLRALMRGEAMPLSDCSQYWNYLYVDDAARALETLAEPEWEDGIYNVAGGISAPLKDFVMNVCARFRNAAAPRFGAVPHGPRGPLSLRPSVEKIMKNTGWRESTSFAEGIEKTVSFIQHDLSTSL